MRDDTKIALTTPAVPQTSGPAGNNTYQLEQKGDGTNIGVAQNVDQRTVICISTQNRMENATNLEYQKPVTLNTEYFSLFVIAHEKYNQPYVLIDLDRALTIKHGTNDAIHSRLASFSEEAVKEIKTYPALFARVNYRCCKPDEPNSEPQYAAYGFVTDVKVQDNDKVRVYYEIIPRCNVPQDLLNGMINDLGLSGHDKINELDKTHWSIKNINLIEEMRLKGISLLTPTILQ